MWYLLSSNREWLEQFGISTKMPQVLVLQTWPAVHTMEGRHEGIIFYSASVLHTQKWLLLQQLE